MHRNKVVTKDALSRTVYDAFNEIDNKVLANVHERWVKVLDLIVKGDGSNDLVEMERGLKSNPIVVCDFKEAVEDVVGLMEALDFDKTE